MFLADEAAAYLHEPGDPDAGPAGLTKAGVTGVSGRRWVERPYDAKAAMRLAQAEGLEEPLARALSARQVDRHTVGAFLQPRLKTSLPDPHVLRDMDRAAERVAQAVRKEERIAVFGDFDVDGTASAALIARYLRGAGIDTDQRLTVYIPNRLTEGYGPSPAVMAQLAASADVILTVDCGITAPDAIAAATAAGADVVVLDHHRPGGRLPVGHAIVNPNREDDTSDLGQLAAVGVVYLFLIALNRCLRDAGFFTERDAPDLMALLELVALGTVCDAVPLTGLNRVFVAQGLRLIERSALSGIAFLLGLDNGGSNPRVDTETLGFRVGPRLNAAGRLGQSILAYRLLATDSDEKAAQIGTQLDLLNKQRQAIEAEVLKAARAAADTQADTARILLAFGNGWHQGVLGIVAGRLRERHGRPALVASVEDGPEGRIAKGSGRSIPGVNLGAAVLAAREAGICLTGGGHAMAAGFSVPAKRLEAFQRFIEAHAAANSEPGWASEPEPYTIDGWVSPNALSLSFVDRLAAMAPFGQENPPPCFAVSDMVLAKADIVGRNHLRCRFRAGDGGPGTVTGIAFKAKDTPVGAALLSGGEKRWHVMGTPRIDTWQDRRRVDLLIQDVAQLG